MEIQIPYDPATNPLNNNEWSFPLLEIIHIVGFAVAIGTIFMVDLRLMRNPDFAITFILMLMLGFMLLGSTFLIPAFAQSLMGYRAVDAGMVWVNSENNRHLPTPFGGMKASGIGRDGGDYSFDFYMETKNICIAHGTHKVPKLGA